MMLMKHTYEISLKIKWENVGDLHNVGIQRISVLISLNFFLFFDVK